MADVATFYKDNVKVKIYPSRGNMGEAAAQDVARRINLLLQSSDADVNIIFAAAPSQNEFLEALVQERIDWSRVNGFHMDEYVGLSPEAPQAFGNFLKQRLFGRVPFKEVYYLKGTTQNIQEEIQRYSDLLEQHPVSIVCMGIGENTHIAFNDPHVAKFDDPDRVKLVELDNISREQQVNDGCFRHIDDVPTHALTLTIPALLKAGYLYCIVPTERKASAISHTLTEPVSEKYPSTILRNHKHATLYLDQASAKLVSYE